MNTYRYAAVNRPVGFATVPDGYLRVDPQPDRGEPFHDWARHGVVVYDRPLTDAETRGYELALLLDADAEQALANRVAEQESEYAEELVEIAAESFDEFRAMVASSYELIVRGEGGYRPVIGDFSEFARRVLSIMKRE